MNINRRSNPVVTRWRRLSVVILVVLILAVGTFAQTPVRRNGKIAFTSDRDGNREIYVMDADGTNQVRLTNNGILDDHARWSPDGKKIAFLSQRPTSEFAIFIMDADGTGRTEVTSVNHQLIGNQWFGWDGWSMSWSPDGRSIAFQDGPLNGSTIMIVNADGSNRRNLTAGIGPAWSPDGSKILFLGGPSGIATIRPNGTDLQPISLVLPGYPLVAVAPDWSPDGTKIAVTGNDSANGVIFVANADGSNPQLSVGECANFARLAPNGCSGTQLPDWSPDGRKIAFVNSGIQSGTEIYAADLVTSDSVRLSNSGGYQLQP